MFRVAPDKEKMKPAGPPPEAPPGVPPGMPEATDVETMPQDAATSQPAEVGDDMGGDEPMKVYPDDAKYMTGDKGPFRCDRCCYYKDPGECNVVGGPIDPAGCCNLYCPPNHDGAEQAEPMAEEVGEPPQAEAQEATLESPETN